VCRRRSCSNARALRPRRPDKGREPRRERAPLPRPATHTRASSQLRAWPGHLCRRFKRCAERVTRVSCAAQAPSPAPCAPRPASTAARQRDCAQADSRVVEQDKVSSSAPSALPISCLPATMRSAAPASQAAPGRLQPLAAPRGAVRAPRHLLAAQPGSAMCAAAAAGALQAQPARCVLLRASKGGVLDDPVTMVPTPVKRCVAPRAVWQQLAVWVAGGAACTRVAGAGRAHLATGPGLDNA
jgi:hypothetical protein